jgi:hypothetical protein
MVIKTSLYQIDFSAMYSGKTFGATKRTIKFCFGFADQAAIAKGYMGADCRGEEHEVVCIWSVSSGKQKILMDGKEIHRFVPLSGGGCQAKLEHSFHLGKHHEMKLVAHAFPPVVPTYLDGSEQRQFDLFLDGLSFFEFFRLFELGRDGAGKLAKKNNAAATNNKVICQAHKVGGRALYVQTVPIF